MTFLTSFITIVTLQTFTVFPAFVPTPLPQQCSDLAPAMAEFRQHQLENSKHMVAFLREGAMSVEQWHSALRIYEGAKVKFQVETFSPLQKAAEILQTAGDEVYLLSEVQSEWLNGWRDLAVECGSSTSAEDSQRIDKFIEMNYEHLGLTAEFFTDSGRAIAGWYENWQHLENNEGELANSYFDHMKEMSDAFSEVSALVESNAQTVADSLEVIH